MFLTDRVHNGPRS